MIRVTDLAISQDGDETAPCNLCGQLTPTAWLQPERYQEWDALCPRCFCRAHAHSWHVHARDQARRDRLRQAGTLLC